VALPVAAVCREKNKVALFSGAGSSELTGKQCSPNTVHWTYDTYMLGKGIGDAITKAGGQSWFFILPDFIFGHELFDETSRLAVAAGGEVLGSAVFPFPDSPKDLSGLLQRAQRRARPYSVSAVSATRSKTRSSRRGPWAYTGRCASPR
jgi:branched-chain amino acid transport system substrate-binding protein